MVVYLDLVVFLNFAVDFLLLLGTNRLAGFPAGAGRCAAGAALGGLYAFGCLLPGFHFLGNCFWRTVSLGLMGAIAFGCSRSALRRCCVFLLLAMALGGVAVSMGRQSVPEVILWAAVLWGLCALASGSGPGAAQYRILKLTLGEHTLTVTALHDTGNTLRDPITGEPAAVIGPQAACRLTGLTQQQLRHPLQTLTEGVLPGLRLIPYRSVGAGGMLLAMKIADAEVDGKKQSLLVAFAPEGLGQGELYQALTGGAI